jgi:hypothetical protein
MTGEVGILPAIARILASITRGVSILFVWAGILPAQTNSTSFSMKKLNNLQYL